VNAKETLDNIFDGYLAKRGVKREVSDLIDGISVSDVDMLLDKIESIGDVDDYANDLETSIPVESFFAFVDLISAIIILMGPEAIEKIYGRSESKSRYMPWVSKFVLDERFHKQVKAQLPKKYR